MSRHLGRVWVRVGCVWRRLRCFLERLGGAMGGVRAPGAVVEEVQALLRRASCVVLACLGEVSIFRSRKDVYCASLS